MTFTYINNEDRLLEVMSAARDLLLPRLMIGEITV